MNITSFHAENFLHLDANRHSSTGTKALNDLYQSYRPPCQLSLLTRILPGSVLDGVRMQMVTFCLLSLVFFGIS